MILWGRRIGFLGNDNYTKLLLHMDGADAVTSLPDNSRSNHTITAVGSAQVDTAQSKFGGAALLLEGTDDYLTTPIDADFHFGTGNFTVDFWVRFSDLTTPDQIQVFFVMDQASGSSIYFQYTESTQKLAFQALVATTPVATYTANWTPSLNTWYHLAVVRNGTSLAIYVDGTALALTETVAIGSNDIGVDDGGAIDTVYIGSWGTVKEVYGHIDEFRVSKGIARWTANFTPQTIAYR